MATPRSGETRGIGSVGRAAVAVVLFVWALIVLALYLVEHPAIFTINPYSDLTPVRSAFSPEKLIHVARGFLACAGILIWCGLVGRSVTRPRGTARPSRAEAPTGDATETRDAFLPEERSLAVAIACAIGMLVMTAVTFVFGFAGLLGTPLLVILGVSLVALVADNRDLLLNPPRPPQLPRHKTDWAVLLMLSLALVAGLVMHLSPIIGTDALVYHLQIPRDYIEAGKIERIPYNVYANMPHATELLYAVALLAGGEDGAKLLDLGLRVLLLLAIAGFARRWLGVRRSLLAPCILLMNPLVLDNRTIANIDLAMAFVLFVALAEALRWNETGRLSHIVASSVLVGLLAGMKYTGGLFGAALFVTLVVTRLASRDSRAPLSHLLLYPLPAITLFAPWLFKNAAFTGNPVYPLLFERFGGIEWNAELGKRLVEWQRSIGMGRSAADYALIPWNMTVKGNIEYTAFDGIMSPLYLMFIPAVILALPLPPAGAALLVLSTLSLALWAWGPQQLRFFIPALPALSVLAAWVLDRVASEARQTWFARLALAITLAYFTFFTIHIVAVTVPNQLPSAIGLEKREDYLHRRLQPYDPMTRASRELPPNAKLLLVWENRGYYLDRPYIADSFYESSWVMQLLEQDQSGDVLEKRLRDEGVTHVMINDPLGLHFGRYYYHPRVREALDRFLRERGKPVFELNGLRVVELRGKEAPPPKAKRR
ncbi:MAG: ArnT family glycosyltransferase [bacterium]